MPRDAGSRAGTTITVVPQNPKPGAGWRRKRKSGPARRRPGRPRRRRLAAASRRACRCMGWTDGATGRTNVSTGGVVRRSCPPDAGRCPRPCARASPPAPKFCASIRPRGCSSTKGSYISARRRDCPTMYQCPIAVEMRRRGRAPGLPFPTASRVCKPRQPNQASAGGKWGVDDI